MAKNRPQICSHNTQDCVIISLLSQQYLEEGEIAELERSLLELISKTDILNIVLDFETVKFLSSAVLRVLIKVHTVIGQRHGQLRLCFIDPKILEVFKITKLDKVFDIRANIDAALESFKKS
jgi:anti-sigma B factor antagonist